MPCCFCRRRKSKHIRIRLRATRIKSTFHPFSPPAGQYLRRIHLPRSNTVILNVRLYLFMIISGQCHFKTRVSLTDQADGLLHLVHRPLIHRYRCLPEPSFIFQMPGKIHQKRQPKRPVFSRSHLSLNKLHAIRGLVIVTKG